AEHVLPQSIPSGTLVTTPPPLPSRETETVYGTAVVENVAETEWARSIVTEHDLVPVQSPPQPANSDPESALAVRVTCVAVGKDAEHPPGHDTPAGSLATVPDPDPVTPIESVYCAPT